MTSTSTPLLQLTGTARQRGLAYGEEARRLIRIAADRWEQHVGPTLTVGVHRYLDALVSDTEFVATTRRLIPDVAEEIEAISEASGIALNRIWALNLLDEEWWFRARYQMRDARSEHCSSLGVCPGPGQPAWIAQNMDLPEWLDGLQIVLRIDGNGPRALLPTYAGMVALNGINEHGIGLCMNTLPQLPNSEFGLPVAAVVRRVMTCRDYAEAVEVLFGTPHASGQNYLIASPEAVGDFECSAAGAAEYRPGDFVTHTNHPLVATQEPSDGAAVSNPATGNSAIRFEFLQSRVDEEGLSAPEQAMALLIEPPLWRGDDGDDGFTLYSLAMLPSGCALWLRTHRRAVLEFAL